MDVRRRMYIKRKKKKNHSCKTAVKLCFVETHLWLQAWCDTRAQYVVLNYAGPVNKCMVFSMETAKKKLVCTTYQVRNIIRRVEIFTENVYFAGFFSGQLP